MRGIHLVDVCFICGIIAAGAMVNAGASARSETTISRTMRLYLEEIEDADHRSVPAHGQLEFVGSASIMRFDATSYFGTGVIKRGFKDLRLTDLSQAVDRMIVTYEPRAIVIYAGENDIVNYKSNADEVARNSIYIVGYIHKRLPRCRIIVLSIKIGPARTTFAGEIRRANAKIASFAVTAPWLSVINSTSGLEDRNGVVRQDFITETYYLNEKAYLEWSRKLLPLLR